MKKTPSQTHETNQKQPTKKLFTVNSLAKTLKIPTQKLIQELETFNESPIIPSNKKLNPNSVLSWKTVERTRQRHGLPPTQNKTNQEITPEEWQTLKLIAKEAAAFHRLYGQTLKKHTEKADPETALELKKHHDDYANAIEKIIKKLKTKFQKQKNQEIN